MLQRIHAFPDLCLLLMSFLIQAWMTRWALKDRAWAGKNRVWLWGLNFAIALITVLGFLGSFQRFLRWVPNEFVTWASALGLTIIGIMIGTFLALLVWRSMPPFQSPRRRFLQTSGSALAIAPVAITTFGFVSRDKFQLREVRIKIPNLHKDLEGLRMVQITDIHLSPFLSESDFARAVDMANETKAQIALITGDLITRRGDPLDACLRQLSRVRAEAAILGCLGNHEVYTDTEDYVTKQAAKSGIEFLRQQSRALRFGNASLNFAGVDYQSFHDPYLVGAEKLAAPASLNVLLSHNPDVFPVAAKKGFDLTVSGHTHGGQVNMEILRQNLNFARTFTPFVRGLYEKDGASVYVSSGVGTIGVPVRVGAPAEIALITLCRSDT